MPRRKLIRTTHFPYHLYGRSNNREWFYLPLSEVWKIFCEGLAICTEEGLQVHAFVLMSNHYHLLASSSQAPIDHLMWRLLTFVSSRINARAGRINHVFGGPYKWTLLEDAFSFSHVFRYVYQNPVRAGLAERVEDFPYSSIHGLGFPMACHLFEGQVTVDLRNRKLSRSAWLNEIYDSEHKTAMQRALYHHRFRFTPDRSSRRLPSQFQKTC